MTSALGAIRGFGLGSQFGWPGSVGLPLAALVFCYGAVVPALVRQWATNDIYSHGFLVPLISAYMVWLRRERLARAQVVPDLAGGSLALAVSLGAFVAGHVGGMIVLQQASLVGAVAGMVLSLFGRRVFRLTWLPIGYLLFMIPIWEILTAGLHLPFQLLSADIGVSLLQLVGIPARQQATYVDLPNVRLEVARVCSGVNYLIAVVAIGIPVAYFSLRGWSRRIVLLIAAVGVAAVANGLRVALIGVLAYNRFAGDIHGPWHVLQGLFVSALGFASLFGGAWLLSRRGGAIRPVAGVEAGAWTGQASVRSRPTVGVVLFVSALFLLAGTVPFLDSPSPVKPPVPLAALPLEIDGWHGSPARSRAPEAFAGLLPDDQLSRTYVSPASYPVDLYVGYFGAQSQGREIVSYLTRDLERDARQVTVSLTPGISLVMNEVVQRADGRQRLLTFWYDLNGRLLVDGYLVKAFTVWDRIAHGRSSGALVAVSVEVPAGEVPAPVAQARNDFLSALWPRLVEHLPRS